MKNLTLTIAISIFVLTGCNNGSSSSGGDSNDEPTNPETPNKQYAGRYTGQAKLEIFYELTGTTTAFIPMKINVNSNDSTYTITLQASKAGNNFVDHTARGTLNGNRFDTQAGFVIPDCQTPSRNNHSIHYTGRIENNRAIGTLAGTACPIDFTADISGEFNLTK